MDEKQIEHIQQLADKYFTDQTKLKRRRTDKSVNVDTKEVRLFYKVAAFVGAVAAIGGASASVLRVWDTPKKVVSLEGDVIDIKLYIAGDVELKKALKEDVSSIKEDLRRMARRDR